MYVKQLDKTRYRVWVDLEPDYTGKRRQKSKVFHATGKRDLNKQIAKWVETMSHISTDCSTVSEMIETVWEHVVLEKSPNTIVGYESCRRRIDSTMGLQKLEYLTPRTIQLWVNDIAKTFSPKTVRLTYSLFHRCCSIAVNWGIMPSSPCHDIILPVKKKEEIRILSQEEFKTFCENLDMLPLDERVLIELALFGSLRRGEIMGIYENEIPEDGRFFVQRTRYTRSNKEYIKDTKTSAGERLCILPEPVVRDVIRLREYHKEQKRLRDNQWLDSPFLIREANGDSFHPNNAAPRLKRYMKKIGLEPITFHALRHTYASICISLGADPATVSKRMGHASVSTTLAVYTHLFESMKKEDALSAALGGMLEEVEQNNS